jgi:hypothetical protein
MSLLQISFIMCSTMAVYLAMSPPHQPDANEKLIPTGVEYKSVLASVIQKVCFMCAVEIIFTEKTDDHLRCTGSFFSCEAIGVAVILASASPFSPGYCMHLFLGQRPPCTLPAANIKINRTYLVGFSQTPSFTQHAITSSAGSSPSNPHPSYTGAILIVTVCYTGEGSWATECTSNGQLLPVLAWLWVLYGFSVFL